MSEMREGNWEQVVNFSFLAISLCSDQWLDVESPDMYPVGWCFLAKHRLEAPKSAVKPLPVKGPKKRGRKKIKVEEGEGKSGVVGGGRLLNHFAHFRHSLVGCWPK